jgi:hypothetical protein
MRMATSKTDSVSISNRPGGGLIGAIIFDPGGRALLRLQPLMSLQGTPIQAVRRSLT